VVRVKEDVLSAVAALPKDELASMAETLVSLTSFKRNVTLEEERAQARLRTRLGAEVWARLAADLAEVAGAAGASLTVSRHR
jgi:hypothetical protein